MAKKMTLDKTWTECIALWKKTIALLDKYEGDVFIIKDLLVGEKYIKNDCYFCEYAQQHSGERTVPEICEHCPGAKAAGYAPKELDNFWCEQLSIDWNSKPLKFYAELLRLNKLRLKKKAKK
jgi:hypothetical protein